MKTSIIFMLLLNLCLLYSQTTDTIVVNKLNKINYPLVVTDDYRPFFYYVNDFLMLMDEHKKKFLSIDLKENSIKEIVSVEMEDELGINGLIRMNGFIYFSRHGYIYKFDIEVNKSEAGFGGLKLLADSNYLYTLFMNRNGRGIYKLNHKLEIVNQILLLHLFFDNFILNDGLIFYGTRGTLKIIDPTNLNIIEENTLDLLKHQNAEIIFASRSKYLIKDYSRETNKDYLYLLNSDLEEIKKWEIHFPYDIVNEKLHYNEGVYSISPSGIFYFFDDSTDNLILVTISDNNLMYSYQKLDIE